MEHSRMSPGLLAWLPAWVVASFRMKNIGRSSFWHVKLAMCAQYPRVPYLTGGGGTCTSSEEVSRLERGTVFQAEAAWNCCVGENPSEEPDWERRASDCVILQGISPSGTSGLKLVYGWKRTIGEHAGKRRREGNISEAKVWGISELICAPVKLSRWGDLVWA